MPNFFEDKWVALFVAIFSTIGIFATARFIVWLLMGVW